MRYKITYQKDGKREILWQDNLENLPLNTIKIEKKEKTLSFGFQTNHKKAVLEMFEQLSLMLNANISLNKALELSLLNKQDETIRKILLQMQNTISKGQPIDKGLYEYKEILGEVAILFIKLGIENGNIKESISSLTQLLDEDMKIKTKFQDTFRYPKLLLISLSVALSMIFIFIVPNLEHIFLLNQENIPLASKVLLVLSDLFTQHLFLISVVVFFMAIGVYIVYKRYLFFFHKFFILRIPIIIL